MSRIAPDFIDAHLGAKLRLRREMLKLTRQALAQRLGLSLQQIQKYETGSNRLTAAMLYRLTDVLDVPIGFFFDGLPLVPPQAPPREPPRGEASVADFDLPALWQHYQALPPALRRKVAALVRAMGAAEGG